MKRRPKIPLPTKLSMKGLIGIIYEKVVYEFIAVVTGMAGVLYTIMGVSDKAVIMDSFSVIAGVIALVMGIEMLPHLRRYKMLRRTVLWAASGVVFSITAMACTYLRVIPSDLIGMFLGAVSSLIVIVYAYLASRE
ncbi:TPA: hypothetical protein EYP44_05760 [Candidatus Bathyarchaeota archaeon]|nr:hypothetical protein [Candidatus Bathyarchaeota archaeon]